MKKAALLLVGVMILCSSIGTAGATSFSFDGYITYQTDVVTFNFTLLNDGTDIRVWTDSYDNGLNFDPIVALWAADGSLLAQNDDNPSINTATQTTWDSGMLLSTLTAGNYLFTVASYSNFARGSNLSDGFVYDGLESIPIEQHWNRGRGYYNVNFDGVDSAGPAPVPEPGTFLLLGAGLAGLALHRRRKPG